MNEPIEPAAVDEPTPADKPNNPAAAALTRRFPALAKLEDKIEHDNRIWYGALGAIAVPVALVLIGVPPILVVVATGIAVLLGLIYLLPSPKPAETPTSVSVEQAIPGETQSQTSADTTIGSPDGEQTSPNTPIRVGEMDQGWRWPSWGMVATVGLAAVAWIVVSADKSQHEQDCVLGGDVFTCFQFLDQEYSGKYESILLVAVIALVVLILFWFAGKPSPHPPGSGSQTHGSGGSKVPSNADAAPSASIGERLEHLDKLRARGSVSDDEYRAQRDRILNDL